MRLKSPRTARNGRRGDSRIRLAGNVRSLPTVSPLSLRRYRAERLLREEFEALRGSVIASVCGRLRSIGVSADVSDLEACYAQAWQGLYAAVLDGQEIANPAGWLALVTFRRAIDEHRARRHLADVEMTGAEDRDFAAELDDRIRLRQLFEALRGRLSSRELQAAALCYLQGLSRSEAAGRMGVSETRMRKLMDGHGAGRPGVASKVGALVETIGGGGWCEEQGSLMRGLAYGILDPGGERYRLALIHSDKCPGCRAYVVSLRGLAAVLPPVPALVQWALGGAIGEAGASCGAGIGAGGHAGGGVGSCPGAAGSGAAGALVPAAGPGLGGAVSASGAAGAGGGWLLAGGSVGTKLAVGCLLAFGVGAGCVALTDHPPRAPGHRRVAARAAPTRAAAFLDAPTGESPAVGRLIAGAIATLGSSASARATASVPSSPSQRASREFGPEQAQAPGAARMLVSSGPVPSAKSASLAREAQASEPSGGSESTEARSSSTSTATPLSGARSALAPAAQREFAPG
jgi:DNA-directed RNA polymerase specialized sigma24 family protein